MAARDYEDILLVRQFHARHGEGYLQLDHIAVTSVPFRSSKDCSQSLHNTVIQHLLCSLAHWHAFAKLRVHTDNTLDILEQATRALGDRLRTFVSETCPLFATKELRREAEARHRRYIRQQMSGASTVQHGVSVRRQKTLNLQTYKLHALGDYVSQIRLFGTTDSYSTQTVSSSIRTLNDC